MQRGLRRMMARVLAPDGISPEKHRLSSAWRNSSSNLSITVWGRPGLCWFSLYRKHTETRNKCWALELFRECLKVLCKWSKQLLYIPTPILCTETVPKVNLKLDTCHHANHSSWFKGKTLEHTTRSFLIHNYVTDVTLVTFCNQWLLHLTAKAWCYLVKKGSHWPLFYDFLIYQGNCFTAKLKKTNTHKNPHRDDTFHFPRFWGGCLGFGGFPPFNWNNFLHKGPRRTWKFSLFNNTPEEKSHTTPSLDGFLKDVKTPERR